MFDLKLQKTELELVVPLAFFHCDIGQSIMITKMHFVKEILTRSIMQLVAFAVWCLRLSNPLQQEEFTFVSLFRVTKRCFEMIEACYSSEPTYKTKRGSNLGVPYFQSGANLRAKFLHTNLG